MQYPKGSKTGPQHPEHILRPLEHTVGGTAHPRQMISLVMGIVSDEGAREGLLGMTREALFCRSRGNAPNKDLRVLFEALRSKDVLRGEPEVRGCGWSEGREWKEEKKANRD